MNKRSVFIYFRYLGPSLSDLVFSWGAFDPLWAPFGVLGLPWGSFWASFGTLLGGLGELGRVEEGQHFFTNSRSTGPAAVMLWRCEWNWHPPSNHMPVHATRAAYKLVRAYNRAPMQNHQNHHKPIELNNSRMRPPQKYKNKVTLISRHQRP